MKNLKITVLAFLAALIFFSGGLIAGGNNVPETLQLETTEPEFQKLIKTLRQAAEQKKPYPIYSSISPMFRIERDFGGIFDPTANAIVNFSSSFPFDNDLLFPEYKDYGWTAFQETVSYDKFEKSPEGELCVPAGAMDVRPYPIGQLCFGRGPRNTWRINRYLKGGD
ncbi:MAG: hypothetical protein HQ483_21925 [Rhodospirillales bacterium]|nr:hypothetical protein [Rhodospirillales bacterium]